MAKMFATRQEAADYLKSGGFVHGLNGWKRHDGFTASIQQNRRGNYSVLMFAPATGKETSHEKR